MDTKQQIRSVPWKILDALLVFLIPWVILPIAILELLVVISPYIPQLQGVVTALYYNDPRANFALVVLDVVGSYAIMAFYLRKYRASWRDVGFRRFSVIRSIIFIIAILAIFSISIGIVYAIVQVLLPNFNPNQPQVNEFTNVPTNMRVYSLLALVIIPPLVEEPVFRGFIFPAFSKHFGLAGGAIISSILFGFAHLQANVGIYTFVLGLVLCFMYVRLGSIIPGMALHMLNNYLAYTALYQPK